MADISLETVAGKLNRIGYEAFFKAQQADDLADEVSAWNERSLIDALKRQARHQESTRWDTIEFKLDDDL